MNSFESNERRWNSMLRSNLEIEEARASRLNAVLSEFASLTRQQQLSLTDAAMIWGFASLANHLQAQTCEEHLQAKVDVLYPKTQQALRSGSILNAIQIAALAASEHDRLFERAASVGAASVDSLVEQNEDSPIYETAKWLSLRQDILESTSAENLLRLVWAILEMCVAIHLHRLGGTKFESTVLKMTQVVFVCLEIQNDFESCQKSKPTGSPG